MRYICKKCNKEFKYAKQFTEHITRITPCTQISALYYYDGQYQKVKELIRISMDNVMNIDDQKITKEINKLLLIYNNLSEDERVKAEPYHTDCLAEYASLLRPGTDADHHLHQDTQSQ
jgi:hypothetical protein